MLGEFPPKIFEMGSAARSKGGHQDEGRMDIFFVAPVVEEDPDGSTGESEGFALALNPLCLIRDR